MQRIFPVVPNRPDVRGLIYTPGAAYRVDMMNTTDTSPGERTALV